MCATPIRFLIGCFFAPALALFAEVAKRSNICSWSKMLDKKMLIWSFSWGLTLYTYKLNKEQHCDCQGLLVESMIKLIQDKHEFDFSLYIFSLLRVFCFYLLSSSFLSTTLKHHKVIVKKNIYTSELPVKHQPPFITGFSFSLLLSNPAGIRTDLFNI